MEPAKVTAQSAVCALGSSTKEVLGALDRGESGLRPPRLELPFDTVAGMVPDPLPEMPPGFEAFHCRQAQVALLALGPVRDAVSRAIDRYGPGRVSILVGTSTGGLRATEQAYWAFADQGSLPSGFDGARQHNFNAVARFLQGVTGADGPTFTISTACSSSGKTHASALRLLGADMADAAVVVGIDTLCQMTLQGFRSLGVLSSTPCRPFGRDREGINIGEGCAIQLLERRTSEAEPLAWLLGAGESADAYNMSSPHPEGRGAAEAMGRAVEQGGVSLDDIDHINAHGTSTVLNDRAESVAIHTLFGDRVPVTSTKGFTGHCLGAAAAIEAVFAVHAIRSGRIPPTLGAEPLDPEVRCDVVTQPRSAALRRVLSSSFAFGGSNVSLLFGDAPARSAR